MKTSNIFTIQDLNKEAKKFGIELIKGIEYFYCIGLSEYVIDKIVNVEDESILIYSVHVPVFSYLSEEQWCEELKKV